MLHYQAIQGCSEQTALAGPDLSCTYPAHHELESVFRITTIIAIIITIIITIVIIPYFH